MTVDFNQPTDDDAIYVWTRWPSPIGKRSYGAQRTVAEATQYLLDIGGDVPMFIDKEVADRFHRKLRNDLPRFIECVGYVSQDGRGIDGNERIHRIVHGVLRKMIVSPQFVHQGKGTVSSIFSRSSPYGDPQRNDVFLNKGQIHEIAWHTPVRSGKNLVDCNIHHVQTPAEDIVGNRREKVVETRLDPLNFCGSKPFPVNHDLDKALLFPSTGVLHIKSGSSKNLDVNLCYLVNIKIIRIENVTVVRQAEGVPMKDASSCNGTFG